MSVTLASQIIGFISFSITLLTLLGVYSDLIKTLRGAPSTIPLALSNLREEIQFEQLYTKAKLRDGDEYDCFPDTKSYKRRRREEFATLMDETLRHLWREFCDLERPFLLKDETPWTLQGLDGGFESDFEEKLDAVRRRRADRRPSRRESYIKNRMGMIEAGLSMDKGTYYNTDLAHRFYWWWKADDIRNIADQVQRMQIRRIERDALEADEIIKRLYRKQCRANNWDWRRSDDSEDSQGHDGGSRDSGGDRGPYGGNLSHGVARKVPGHGISNGRHSNKRRLRRQPERTSRELYEREVVRSVRRPDEAASPRTRTSGWTTEPERRPVAYEYEVVNPGRIYVERVRTGITRSPSRTRSYSRERD